MAVVIPYQFRSVSIERTLLLEVEQFLVVIPYQFRSVSMGIPACPTCRRCLSRNPLSIQVCFNTPLVITSAQQLPGRNPLSIQVCFNKSLLCYVPF